MASSTRSRVVAQASLLRLPDPCLLAVMQGCADDASVMLKAATAHSRLQRAAVEAFSSISAGGLDHARFDSLLLYLANHGQHVRSLALHAPGRPVQWVPNVPHYDVQLRELPSGLTKLDSLQLDRVVLQLQPDVLRTVFPLTRLELRYCTLLDGRQELAAPLMQLPDLQHQRVEMHTWQALTFSTDVLTHLVQLTSVLLQGVKCCNGNSSSSDPSATLQPLQALTRLADLQLSTDCVVTADNLSHADQLTRLVLPGTWQRFEPRALAGKSQLQHLALRHCRFVPWADVAQLLLELQHLTKLAHLDLGAAAGGMVQVAPALHSQPTPA